MTQDARPSPAATQQSVDQDRSGALLHGAMASIATWVGCRVAPWLDHRLAVMVWVTGPSVAIGGLVYCSERARPFLLDETVLKHRRGFSFQTASQTLNVLWAKSYAPEGRQWVRGAWTCGMVAALLWMATGIFLD
jgi:hypothetical protein